MSWEDRSLCAGEYVSRTIIIIRKGLNFAVVPPSLPTEEIVTSTELACKSLDQETAAKLRSEVARSVSKRTKKMKRNLSLEEIKALQELKKDNDLTILPADKGRATVVLDRKEYEQKIETLLSDQKTYELLKKDPTTTVKNKLINQLKTWKKEGTISNDLYKKIYPTFDQAPKFYGILKIHKKRHALKAYSVWKRQRDRECCETLIQNPQRSKRQKPTLCQKQRRFCEQDPRPGSTPSPKDGFL